MYVIFYRIINRLNRLMFDKIGKSRIKKNEKRFKRINSQFSQSLIFNIISCCSTRSEILHVNRGFLLPFGEDILQDTRHE